MRTVVEFHDGAVWTDDGCMPVVEWDESSPDASVLLVVAESAGEVKREIPLKRVRRVVFTTGAALSGGDRSGSDQP